MRRSATTGADAVEEPRDALTVLPLALLHALAARIWAALPADVRMRCREVCPAWRDTLAEPRLWTELDLTAASGVARVTPALLLSAAARAAGYLERLCVTHTEEMEAPLLAVVAANAETRTRCGSFASRVPTPATPPSPLRRGTPRPAPCARTPGSRPTP